MLLYLHYLDLLSIIGAIFKVIETEVVSEEVVKEGGMRLWWREGLVEEGERALKGRQWLITNFYDSVFERAYKASEL